MRTFALGATLVAALALAACGQESAPDTGSEEQAAPVRTAPAVSAAVTDEVRAVGLLTPRDELRLSFKTGGVIDAVMVDVGDRVQAGQPLASQLQR